MLDKCVILIEKRLLYGNDDSVLSTEYTFCLLVCGYVKPQSHVHIHCNCSANSPRLKFIEEVTEESKLGFAVGRR